MKKFTFLITALLVLAACDQKGSTDSTKERARAEQEANKEVDNNNLAKKAEKMEEDLQRRYHYYKAVSGDFAGRFVSGQSTFNMKLSMFPTLHIVPPGRVRTLEEIQDDINNLALAAQVEVESIDGVGVGGHTFDKIKADFNNGQIQLVSAIEPLRYVLTFSENSADSRSISVDLLNGNIDQIDTVFLRGYSKFGASYKSVLKRK